MSEESVSAYLESIWCETTDNIRIRKTGGKKKTKKKKNKNKKKTALKRIKTILNPVVRSLSLPHLTTNLDIADINQNSLISFIFI